MAFDGIFAKKVTAEIKYAVNCHVDKIYQASRDELIILLRKKQFVKWLLISARPGASRIHFTEKKPETPTEPPMFCMLARKYFSAAKLTAVTQPGSERLIQLVFETSDEMGDRITPSIICELIGNQSNIILLDSAGKIIDAVHRSDIETAKRIIAPGAVYKYPPQQDKLELEETSSEEIADAVLKNDNMPLSKSLLFSIGGLSPLGCREIVFRAFGEDVPVSDVDRTMLIKAVEDYKHIAIDQPEPVMLYDNGGIPADYSYISVKQYGSMYTQKKLETFSAVLDAFYSERDIAARMHKASFDLIKLVSNLLIRADKRIHNREKELSATKDREKLRIYGELIKANIPSIKNGASKADVVNFYDENLASISIPLDPALSPAANAAKYFKDYKKSYTAEQTLSELIVKDKEEIEYLNSVAESLSRCRTSADIAEIRAELSDEGYIKRQNGKKKKTPPTVFNEYKSREGYRILVGKNNVQNDLITTKIASKQDIWFHTKNIPGSHVVIMSGGNEVSEETLLFAAELAAENSKAAGSSNIPVDYTDIKYVKKPSGSRAGKVVYTTNKTLYVTPKTR